METEERVACPWCAEQIMPAAIVCPHCQRNTGFVAPPPKEPTHSGLSAAVIVALVFAGLALLLIVVQIISAAQSL